MGVLFVRWIYLITPGFLERSDSIFLTQEPHVIPAMERVHDRTGSVAIPEDEEPVVRGAIEGSLKERVSSITESPTRFTKTRMMKKSEFRGRFLLISSLN